MESEWVAVIIEDDPDVRDLLDIVLTQSGFHTVVASNGPEGVEAVRRHDPLLTTLDVNMPGMDGFAVAKRLREFSNTYLIMITALNDEIDVVQGLEAGADDYLVKPFRPRELRARADSMLRRPRARQEQVGPALSEPDPAPTHDTAESWAAAAARDLQQGSPLSALSQHPEVAQPPAAQPPAAWVTQPPQQMVQPVAPPAEAPRFAPLPPAPAPASQQHQPGPHHSFHSDVDQASVDGAWVRFNGLALNTDTRVVTVNERSVELTRTEFDLLASLLSTGRRVRSKADLVLTMRGQNYVTAYFVNEADKRAVEVHIANLRRKIGDDAATPRFIETVRGVGYRLAVEL
ncbi:hypothetical protein GCM10027026_41480 [Myroides odoratimimus subsp. xuanwuensis]